MPYIDTNEGVWEYAFLSGPQGMPTKDREKLVLDSIELYKKGRGTLNSKGETYEGLLKHGERAQVGSFGGTRIDGKIETEKGRKNLIGLILTNHSSDPSLN